MRKTLGTLAVLLLAFFSSRAQAADKQTVHHRTHHSKHLATGSAKKQPAKHTAKKHSGSRSSTSKKPTPAAPAATAPASTAPASTSTKPK
jgi:hypothetical protein